MSYLKNEYKPRTEAVTLYHVVNVDGIRELAGCNEQQLNDFIRMVKNPAEWIVLRQVVSTVWSQFEEVNRSCNVPPPGWRCTRTTGHDGPCAAVEDKTNVKIAQNVPEPPELTEEDWKRIDEESKAWSKAFREATKDMDDRS